MKVMIVDDHASARGLIRKFLNFPGITFCECASGEEAVRVAGDFKPDWVTMDVHMPGLNGFQTTEALRGQHPHARVMIVTSDNQPHFRQLSRAAGAVGLILKENLLALHLMFSKEVNARNADASVASQPGANL